MNKAMFLIGLVCCLTAAGILFFVRGSSNTPVIFLGIIGVLLIATSSRKRQRS
jgi:hypothetical protein